MDSSAAHGNFPFFDEKYCGGAAVVLPPLGKPYEFVSHLSLQFFFVAALCEGPVFQLLAGLSQWMWFAVGYTVTVLVRKS